MRIDKHRGSLLQEIKLQSLTANNDKKFMRL